MVNCLVLFDIIYGLFKGIILLFGIKIIWGLRWIICLFGFLIIKLLFEVDKINFCYGVLICGIEFGWIRKLIFWWIGIIVVLFGICLIFLNEVFNRIFEFNVVFFFNIKLICWFCFVLICVIGGEIKICLFRFLLFRLINLVISNRLN